MSDVFYKFAKLKALYPDPADLARIEAEEEEVKRLMEEQDFYGLAVTHRLLALFREEIVRARKRLATERDLNDDQRRNLWAVIDAESMILNLISKDYKTELIRIEADLDAELQV